jgi:hypothetical protein
MSEKTTDLSVICLPFRGVVTVAAFLISGAVNLTLIYTDLYGLHDTVSEHYNRVDRKDERLQEQIDELKQKVNEKR